MIVMIRKIVQINEEACNGCGACADACHEGAITMVNGKAKLIRDDYCDGLGNCLPACPADAITIIEREADPFDEEAVKKNVAVPDLPCGCPGTHEKKITHVESSCDAYNTAASSELSQWPVQIKLINSRSGCFNNAHLLVSADCCAYAYGSFHRDFIKNKVTIVGCPKLDMVDYTEKLTDIIANNNIKSVTVTRMEVPCCGGIEEAVKSALKNSGKFIPWQVVTISTDGSILEN